MSPPSLWSNFSVFVHWTLKVSTSHLCLLNICTGSTSKCFVWCHKSYSSLLKSDFKENVSLSFVISCFILKFCPHVTHFAFHFLSLCDFQPCPVFSPAHIIPGLYYAFDLWLFEFWISALVVKCSHFSLYNCLPASSCIWLPFCASWHTEAQTLNGRNKKRERQFWLEVDFKVDICYRCTLLLFRKPYKI